MPRKHSLPRKEIIRRFPRKHKFINNVHKQRRTKLPNILQMINSALHYTDLLHQIQNISQRDCKRIEMRTRGQARNNDWFFYRQGIITATLSYRISRAIKAGKGRSVDINCAISKTYNVQLHYPAIVWGRENEKKGITAAISKLKLQHHNVNVKNAGLRLDTTHRFIGGSVDAIMHCSCCKIPKILEIKCPYSIKDGTVEKDGHKLTYLDDKLKLKKTHPYYYQIQTYLGIYQYQEAYLGVWTPNDIYITKITFDTEFWINLKNDLYSYYVDNYLNYIL